MSVSFFDIPRELRNKIYKHASSHADGGRKPFSTFELPWAVADFLQNCKVAEEQDKDNKPMYKIPKQADQARLDRAPAIIDHPLAFTCKQALMEYIEECRFHAGKTPAIALVAETNGKIHSASGVSAQPQPSIDKLEANELVSMLLTEQLPSHARIRLHCDLHRTAVYKVTSSYIQYNCATPAMLSSIAKHAKELHFEIHSLVSSKEQVISDNKKACDEGLVGEGAPDKITIRFSDAREELFEFKAVHNGDSAMISSWAMDGMHAILWKYASDGSSSLNPLERSNHCWARVEDIKRRMAARRRQVEE